MFDLLALAIALLVLPAAAETASVRVQADQPGASLNPFLYGNNVIATGGAAGPALRDAETGEWRAKVVDAVRDLAPTILRFPGGAKSESYQWQQGVGEQPREPDYAFGTDEWMQLCDRVGAQPMITANWLTGSPQQAARWVDYCNGPATSRYGKLRAKNGHPEPYGVKYWELGNEPTHTAQVRDYALTLDAYAQAMKRVDPTIQLGGCAWQARGWMNHYRPDDVPWTETLLKLAGDQLDFLIIHTYLWVGTKPETVDDAFIEAALAYPEQLDDWLRQTRAMCVEAGYPNLPIFVTEYNGYYGQSGMSPALTQQFNAVLQCETLHSFANAGIDGACYWELASYGWDHFANVMLADGKHFALRPTYQALKLYREQVSGRRLPTEVQCSTYAAAKCGVSAAQPAAPSLDALATLRDDGAVVVACVWRRTTEPCIVSVELAGKPIQTVTLYSLVADGPAAGNTHVETKELVVSDGKLTFELPRVSAGVLVAK